MVSAIVSNKDQLMKKLTEAEQGLRQVIVPGFDANVISSRVVAKLRISRDGNIIGVYVDFSGSDPGCYFRRTLNESLWRILEDIYAKLLSLGFKEVIFIDYRSGMKIDLSRNTY
mgnify:CR=1 FL=1